MIFEAAFFYAGSKMNELMNVNVLTMSSREMSVLTEIRHDSVKRTIDTLFEKGIIRSPQIVNFKNINNVDGIEYLVEKRDSFIIVAQLSPEFTAKLVDRWQELEGAQIPKTRLELAREQLVLIEEIDRQEKLLELQAPKVEIANALIADAKLLSISESPLFRLSSGNTTNYLYNQCH
jgi:phage regulator Rha-like protein